MGATYSLFTEAYIDEKWVCINRHMHSLKRNEGDELCIVPTYENCSRSYFSAAAEKLEYLGSQVQLKDLSEEIRTCHPDWDDKYIPKYSVPLESIRSIMPEGQKKEHHAFVPKDDVFRFEADEIEYFDTWLDAEQYMALDEEVKKAYQYYEWNDEDGWYKYFILLLEHVGWQIWEWAYYNSHPDKVRILLLIF